MSEELNRQKRIQEKIQTEETVERRDTEAVKQAMLEFLRDHKGYLSGEIEIDREFQFSISDRQETSSTDFIIKLKGKRFMAIRCAASALESRERHILAFSRVVDSYQIPLSVVTDGLHARLIDTVSGDIISEDINSIPSREEALGRIEGMQFVQYPAERMEKEKRILLAFDSISCPVES